MHSSASANCGPRPQQYSVRHDGHNHLQYRQSWGPPPQYPNWDNRQFVQRGFEDRGFGWGGSVFPALAGFAIGSWAVGSGDAYRDDRFRQHDHRRRDHENRGPRPGALLIPALAGLAGAWLGTTLFNNR